MNIIQNMINLPASNLIVIIFVANGWFLWFTCAINFLQQHHNDEKSLFILNQKKTPKIFIIKNNQNITLTNYSLSFYKPTALGSTPPSQLLNPFIYSSVVEEMSDIYKSLPYKIIESNQQNNSNNQEQQMSSLFNSLPSLSLLALPSQVTNSSAPSYLEHVKSQETLDRMEDKKLLLHRNKRYLLFPEGSSFQLVFDLIIPIVDYTNYAIMGITCAVAWELPSKPPSEIIENFRTKLNDGTFGLSRRNDSVQQQLRYVDGQHAGQNTLEGHNSLGEGATMGSKIKYHVHYPQHQLSATVATTSKHQYFLANAFKSPQPLPSKLYYNNNNNNIQQEKTQQPTTTFVFSQHPQRQKWYDYNFGTADANQKKTFHGNDVRWPVHRKGFTSHTNKYIKTHPAYLRQPPQTKNSYTDAGEYWNKDSWWKRNRNRIQKHWKQNQQKWSQYQKNQQNYQTPVLSKRTAGNRIILTEPPKHRIYPIFGKRRQRRTTSNHCAHSHDDDLAKKLNDVHIKEHLRTRQKLYKKIEKLYKARGHNGTACVLRALCETEKIHLNSNYDETPQNFVMELLRSIFALPKEILTNSKDSSLHLDARYSKAIFLAHDVTQNCSQLYDDCKYTITYDTQL